MPTISLNVFRSSHEPAVKIGYTLAATRIVAHLCFQTETGWTPYRVGVVDTGAAVSLLPSEVWRQMRRTTIGYVRVGGIVGRDECRIPAQLATVTCALSDGSQIVGPVNIHAYLAESDEVPLLIGMSDLIEKGVLNIAIGQGITTFAM